MDELKPAASAYLDHVKERAEQRVFDLVALYGEDPKVFRAAFEMPMPEKSLSYAESAHHLFAFCCGIVAMDWTWDITFSDDGKTQEVRVTQIT